MKYKKKIITRRWKDKDYQNYSIIAGGNVDSEHIRSCQFDGEAVC